MSKTREIKVYTLLSEPMAMIDFEPLCCETPANGPWMHGISDECDWMTDLEHRQYESSRHSSRVAVDVDIHDDSDSVLRVNVSDDDEITIVIGTRMIVLRPASGQAVNTDLVTDLVARDSA